MIPEAGHIGSGKPLEYFILEKLFLRPIVSGKVEGAEGFFKSFAFGVISFDAGIRKQSFYGDLAPVVELTFGSNPSSEKQIRFSVIRASDELIQ